MIPMKVKNNRLKRTNNIVEEQKKQNPLSYSEDNDAKHKVSKTIKT